MRTTIHAMPEHAENRARLRQAAYDTNLSAKQRQQAAALLLTSQIPGMVSAVEVDQFFSQMIADVEATLLRI